MLDIYSILLLYVIFIHSTMSYILLYVTWNIFTISYMQSYISYIWVKAIVLCQGNDCTGRHFGGKGRVRLGISPVNLLSFKYRCVNLVNADMQEGIRPSNWFFCKPRCCKFTMADIPSGISPVKHMYANSSKHHYIEIYLHRMIQVMYSKYVMFFFDVLVDIVGRILYFQFIFS